MSGKLNGKVAVVTGASSGIGKATALMFAKEAAKGIVLVSRTQSKLEEVAKEIEAAGSKAVIVAGDVSSEETSKKMVEAAVTEFGQLDVAFLNAGSLAQKKIVELTEEDVDAMFNGNLKSVVWGLKHALPAMKESPNNGSVIVNTSCMGSTARAAMVGSAMYSSAKAAANMLVKYAASEAATDGTRVNAIAPGIVATNIMGLDHATTHGFAKDFQLVGRAGESNEIASVVTMMASNDGNFMTGSIVEVDGGWALKA